MDIHTGYMMRAIQLARNGCLDAAPNPMVGAVIIAPDGRIIGEGWHRRCGEGHAEVNAVASVEDKSMLKDCTMYVTLEPCSHYGKTPPCAKLIIDCGIPRVVIGAMDPYEKVSGRGIAMLREAGVEVTIGIMETECMALNAKFMTAHRLQRPYITLKWAESADGYIDGHISTPLSAMAVHSLRATHDAILVGSGTWLADTPALTNRLFAGHSPRRIVLDRRGRLSLPDDVIHLTGALTPGDAVRNLYDRGITSLLVEGGAKVLTSFIKDDLWDRIRIERSPSEIHGHVKAPDLPPDTIIDTTEKIDRNLIIHISRRDLK